ncbi:S-methyl-5'-thioadenosine phosphorylase [Patescibacteria group bacterium]|nr:S-methyl-5'-thioadenosine phosphorylase [Patescibacteria group bacterium]
MAKQKKQMIGLIGGTGFYEFFEGKTKEIEVRTKFGLPSDKITIGNLFGKKVAFLPRHGRKHQLPPHKIPYQANIAAMKKLGVERIIAPSAVGSLKAKIKPGDFVICDQFIDQTKKREDTFFDGPQVAHIEMAYPYCPESRKIALAQAKKLKLKAHPKGTVVVIEGPRFSTLADSLRFSQMGGDLVNMTQYPEVVLASELGICYLNISLVTDYDVGIYAKGRTKPVSIEEVLANFKKNTAKLKKLVSAIIKNIPERRTCGCRGKAERALIG